MTEDQQLIRQLGRGDFEALSRIYQKYKNYLFTVAICLLNDPALAEDCLHDVFVKLAGNIGSLKIRRNLKGYLTAGIANHARDMLNQKSRQDVSMDNENFPSPADTAAPVQQLIEKEQLPRLNQALEQLSYQQREVITLHLYGKMKFREIARLESISINTALSRYRNGLKKLRSLLTQGAKL